MQTIELQPNDKVKLGLLFLKNESDKRTESSQLMIFALTVNTQTNERKPYRNILFNVKYEQ